MESKQSLKGFLKNRIVVIPPLQRDYAQGRKSQQKLAEEFLASIFEVLKNDKDGLHLDFIYGYQKDDFFFLIDGQQRVTTLWLLHIYFYRKVGETLPQELKNFSYSVRKGSREFCDGLKESAFEMSKKPSEAIKDFSDPFGRDQVIDQDPTVQAMLGMLDLIHREIGDKDQDMIERYIIRLENITFSLFDMGEYSLGEELYIKMNSRGKQLSPYENLKAYMEAPLGEKQEILKKIDTCWSDFFLSSSNDPTKFDEIGMKFLHYANIFFKLYENDQKLENSIKEFLDPERRIDEFYEPLQNEENLLLLDRCIDLILKLKQHKGGNGFRFRLLDDNFFVKDRKDKEDKKMSFASICYFHAFLSYVQEWREHAFDEDWFQGVWDYLRVCRHLIENHPVDEPADIVSFFRLFQELVKGANKIYNFLSEKPHVKGFHSQLCSLEKRKAELILQDIKWQNVLDILSDNSILNGRIDFLLDFCLKPSNEEYDFDNFKRYTNIVKLLANEDFLKDYLSLFQRAFLCVGDFSFYATNYFYGVIPADAYRDRDSLYKLFNSKPQNEGYLFKQFLDQLGEVSDRNELIQKMQGLIDLTQIKEKKWWEQLMIAEEGIFEFLKTNSFRHSKRVRFFDNADGSRASKVELLPRTRSYTNVRDLFDYAFYLHCDKHKGQLKISLYESGEEQYGFSSSELGIKSHFSIENRKIICHSGKKCIWFDNQEYELDFNESIIGEFHRVFGEIKMFLLSQES